MARRTLPPNPATAVATLDPRGVERLRRLAVLLDDSIPIPGTGYRIGVESIVGLVPGVGDLVGGAFSLYILLQAARMGVPRALLARMGWNLAVDVVGGAVPVLGDLFDAGFKANMRNLALLERHVDRPVESRRSSRRFVLVLGLLAVLCLAGAVALTAWLLHLLLTHSLP
jgi:hypothetical protein